MTDKTHLLRDPSGNVVSEITEQDLFAVRNLAKGEASPEQQTRAYRVIVEKIASADDFSYRPDNLGGERITNFNEGRRYVGLNIRKLAAAPVNLLINLETNTKEPMNARSDTGSKSKPRAVTRQRVNTRKPR